MRGEKNLLNLRFSTKNIIIDIYMKINPFPIFDVVCFCPSKCTRCTWSLVYLLRKAMSKEQKNHLHKIMNIEGGDFVLVHVF